MFDALVGFLRHFGLGWNGQYRAAVVIRGRKAPMLLIVRHP